MKQLLFFLLISWSQAVLADLPAPPLTGVRDEAQILTLPLFKATEKILSDHASLTSETVYVLVVKNTWGKNLDSQAMAVLEDWKLHAPKPPNTILVVIDAEQGNVAIKTGIGLDPVLTHDHIQRIRSSVFNPEWKAKRPDRAFVLTLLEVLKHLDSPIFENNQVQEAYENAGFQGGFEPIQNHPVEKRWWLWLLISFGVIGFAMVRALAVEAHYTSLGWVRVPAWKGLFSSLQRGPNKKEGQGIITGGGVHGRW